MVHHPYHKIKADKGRQRDENKIPCSEDENRYKHLYSSEHGAASIEMVFFLLIFAVTFFGAMEMAREVSVKHALDVGTYRAARYLSLVPSGQTTARNMIQSELDRNVLGGSGNVLMTVEMPSPSFQTVFNVTGEVAYQPVIPLMMFAPKTLRIIHSQSIEAYP